MQLGGADREKEFELDIKAKHGLVRYVNAEGILFLCFFV